MRSTRSIGRPDHQGSSAPLIEPLFLLVSGIKSWYTTQSSSHEEDSSASPSVHCKAVIWLIDTSNFRGHVAGLPTRSGRWDGSSTTGKYSVRFSHLERHTKVDNLGKSVVVQEDVLQAQISKRTRRTSRKQREGERIRIAGRPDMSISRDRLM